MAEHTGVHVQVVLPLLHAGCRSVRWLERGVKSKSSCHTGPRMAVLMGGRVQLVVLLSAACRWQISQAAGEKAF